MSNPNVIQQLAQLPAPDQAKIADLLGVEFVQTEERPHSRFFGVESPPAPYARVELRQAKDEPRGLLVLAIDPEAGIGHDDLILPDYGEPTLDVNPHIPPEGVVTKLFGVGAVDLAFQGTTQSRRLRLISLRWTP